MLCSGGEDDPALANLSKIPNELAFMASPIPQDPAFCFRKAMQSGRIPCQIARAAVSGPPGLKAGRTEVPGRLWAASGSGSEASRGSKEPVVDAYVQAVLTRKAGAVRRAMVAARRLPRVQGRSVSHLRAVSMTDLIKRAFGFICLSCLSGVAPWGSFVPAMVPICRQFGAGIWPFGGKSGANAFRRAVWLPREHFLVRCCKGMIYYNISIAVLRRNSTGPGKLGRIGSNCATIARLTAVFTTELPRSGGHSLPRRYGCFGGRNRIGLHQNRCNAESNRQI